MPGPINGLGPVKPPGPIYPPKVPKRPSQAANYESAVLAMVDDVNNPKVATVYINNTIPPEDGYAIPSSLGVTFMAAPAAWSSATNYTPGEYASVNSTAYKCVVANTNSQPPNANWAMPSGVAFYNNPALLDGGSWVTVDTVNKVIVSIQQGESNAPPSNPSDLFRYIRHDGAYNTTGNFQNPGPIDQTQLSTVIGSTVSVSSVSLGSYSVAGTSVGVPVTLTPTYTASSSNIKEFLIICSPHGLATNSQFLFDTQGYPWGSGLIARGSLPASGSSCTINVGGMSTGFAYDLYFYVVGVDGQAIFPSSNPIATTVAQTFQNVAKPSMPAGGTVTATNITETLVEGGFKASASIGYSPSAIVNFNLGDTNNPSTTAWAAQLIGYVRQHSGSSVTDKSTYQQVPTGQITPGNGQPNYIRFNSLTPGQSYDFAFSVADGQGNETPAVSLATNYNVPSVQNSSPIGPILGWRNYLGDTSGDGITALVDGGNKRFLHPSMSAGVQSALDSSGNVLNVEFPGGKLQPNGSITNIDGALSIRVVPCVTGTVIRLKAVIAKGTIANISGLRFYLNGGTYYTFTYDGNGQYYVSLRFAGGTTTVIGTAPGFGSNDTNPHTFIFTLVVGSPNTLYASIDGKELGPLTDSTITGITALNIVPLTGGPNGTMRDFSCIVGAEHYPAMSPEYQANFNSSGSAKKSSMFNANIPNCLTNLLSDVGLSWSTPSAGTLNIWITNAAGTGLPTWTPPDQSGTIAPSSTACGSSSVPLKQFTGLSSSTKYYFVIYYNVNTGAFQNYTTIYSTQPTDAQQSAALADGTIVAVTASANTSSGITPSGGGGTGTSPGGGGHQRYQ